MKPNSFGARLRRAADALYRFFFEPASPRPLGVLRVLVALILLVQAYFLSSESADLFGANGIMQESLTRYLVPPSVPRVAGIAAFTKAWGIGAEGTLLAIEAAYLGALIFLFAGFFTPIAAVFAWFLHWTLMTSGYCTNYGADVFAHIFLFYFIWMPVGRAFSLDELVRKKEAVPTDGARLSLRVIQIHLCFVYLAGGIEKATGPQWWNGDAIWRALMLPVYAQWDFSWMAHVPWLAMLLCWGTLAVEIGYAFLIWPRHTRALWVALTVSLHLGIALFLGLGIFGSLMGAMTFAVFGISAAPVASGNVAFPYNLLRRGSAATR